MTESAAVRPERPARREAAVRVPAPRVPSNALLRGGRRVLIEHRGETYRLELTRQGKLILTK